MLHDPILSIPSAVWRTLLHELYVRTGELHESGAFLLGHIDAGKRRVERVVYYDDLDPLAYSSGVVVMHAASYGPLWDLCKKSGLSVVADIHIHPRLAFQSVSDRCNPMVAMSGHLALIVPFFARPPVILENIGLFEYCGSHRWRTLGGPTISNHFSIEM